MNYYIKYVNKEKHYFDNTFDFFGSETDFTPPEHPLTVTEDETVRPHHCHAFFIPPPVLSLGIHHAVCGRMASRNFVNKEGICVHLKPVLLF